LEVQCLWCPQAPAQQEPFAEGHDSTLEHGDCDAPSETEAEKVESLRSTLEPEHFGQFTFSDEAFTSISNSFSHFEHIYS
jgi:hypothetical protein